MAKATNADVRAFGKKIQKGDRFTNRWEEHGHGPGTRTLDVQLDIRGTAYFVLRDAYTGKTTVMRTRTLLERYIPL